ncbi:acyl-CoA thioesterase [Alicyclobacillus fastidiosus]|uniref:Thioesterase family protein n=1 Tax=Alicyclobacillus fastidiosus TaxID=392011 RepID=A0ABV5ADT9_9BACL|nr:thioesterase family protein [Alicyclobacillus fastidiosus]WEH08556.1 thioesterase family protein [Alicyclobacillus fastidiosus]
MFHESSIRVRFRDTDMYGHVNNASYATFMEEARIQFIEEHFGDFSIPLILASAAYKFISQTKFPEHRDIISRMWVRKLGHSSADMVTHLLAQDGTRLCECVLTVVHFDYEAQKAARIPDDVRRVLERYLHAEEDVPYDK